MAKYRVIITKTSELEIEADNADQAIGKAHVRLEMPDEDTEFEIAEKSSGWEITDTELV